MAQMIGRRAELARATSLRRQLAREGVGWLWITGEGGCGKSQFLQTCATDAQLAGWEVLEGRCTEETSSDPYGPFLSMLGLCFDKGGRLINDRSVYGIIDQISLDDVFDAVADIPGMSMVAFGIKVGMTIFESRRTPRSGSDVLNRNFEFILQLLQQIEQKRDKPVLLALDDLHLASATTYALIEYIATRISTRLLVLGTWRADSVSDGKARVREALPRMVRGDRFVHLSPLSDAQMWQLLKRFCTRSIGYSLSEALIDFGRGLPGVLEEGVRLVETGEEALLDAECDADAAHVTLDVLTARQLERLSADERAMLECAARIGERVPLDVLCAPPLCTYVGLAERQMLSLAAALAERGHLLAWDGDRVVRLVSTTMRTFLRDQVRTPVARQDHLHIAAAWQSAYKEPPPVQLARHYLAGGAPERALECALASAKELSRSVAYPEAVQSYELALRALDQMPHREDSKQVRIDVLQAMGLAAEQTGDWKTALSRLDEALALSESDSPRKAEILAGLGWLYLQRGDVSQAQQRLDQSAELFDALDDAQGRAQVEYYRGLLYEQRKEWGRAIAAFKRYLEVSERAGFDEGQASALIELGNLYRLQQDWEQAEQCLEQGIALAERDRDYVVLAQGYHHLGNCLARQGKDAAVDVLRQALEIVKNRTKQPAQESRILNTLAETLVRANLWEEARDAFHASAAIKERLGDRTGLAITYGGLGRSYLRQWAFDRAVTYLSQDIDLLSEEPEANVAWIQQHTNAIGEARRLQGHLDEAAVCFQRALDLADQISDPRVRAQSLGYTQLLMARLALDRGDLSTADAACTAAQQLLAGTWAEPEWLRTAARLARLRSDLDTARERLDRALAMSDHIEDIDRAQLYLELARERRDSGDKEEMRRWAHRASALGRQLMNAELERRASMLIGEPDGP